MATTCVELPLKPKNCFLITKNVNGDKTFNSCSVDKIESKLRGYDVRLLTEEKELYHSYMQYGDWILNGNDPIAFGSDKIVALDLILGEK